MSILDQYLPKKPTPSAVGEQTPESSHDAASVLERPVSMIVLVMADGTQLAYPYATLLRVMMDRDRGIVLSFTADEVIVEGSSLEPLFKGITQHRLSRVEITVGKRKIGVTTSDVPVITGISVAGSPGDSAMDS